MLRDTTRLEVFVFALALASGGCRPASAERPASAAAAPPLADRAEAPSPPVPPSLLSQTGLYVPGSSSLVRREHLSFSPQYPLWTDGAEKSRWIHLPAGTWIDASDPDAWVFPVGTRLWKEFRFGGRRVETRTLEALPGGTWSYATYLWSPDDSDAVLVPARGIPQGTAVPGPAARHVIPSQTDCRACHEGGRSPVLGFATLQLSPDRDPGALHASPPGPDDVDLAILVARGLVRGLPAAIVARPPRIEAATPRGRAVLGYLHANCGGCHDARGPLAAVGHVLAQTTSDPTAQAVLSSTVGRASHFRAPGRAATLRVAPGDAGASVLSLRMRARDPLAQMPPIGTLAVDEDAVALIDLWIDHDLSKSPTTPRGE